MRKDYMNAVHFDLTFLLCVSMQVYTADGFSEILKLRYENIVTVMHPSGDNLFRIKFVMSSIKEVSTNNLPFPPPALLQRLLIGVSNATKQKQKRQV